MIRKDTGDVVSHYYNDSHKSSSGKTRSSLVLEDKTEIRFTRKNNVLNIFFFSTPANKIITIPNCKLEPGAKAVLIGKKKEEIRLINTDGNVQIQLPKTAFYSRAFLVKLIGLKD
jgi:hypothetical protein